MKNSTDVFLGTQEVAKLLGIKPQTLRVYRVRGSGPPYRRLGGRYGRVIYDYADVMEWIESHPKVTSTSAESA